MRWKVAYPSVSCANCEIQRSTGPERDRRRPKCEVRGREHCPISAGTAPVLTPDLHEAANIFYLLTNEFISRFPALQQAALDAYVTPKDEVGMTHFFRRLLYMVELYKDAPPPEGHATSKGVASG